MARRNREYVEFLKEKFNEQKYIEFINDLLNLSHEDINTSIVELVPHQKQFKETIEYYKFIANYTTNSDKIGIFIVKLSTEISQNARTAQRSFISTLLSKYNLDASIVAFYQDNESSWRLSFVKKELSFTETGIKVDLSPAKRYSYLVGENEAVHTAQEYLFKLFEIEDRKITLSDIEKVFDVEKVTKKFFEEYKEKYLKLKEYLDSNEDFITESKNCDFTSEEFAKKLMGQIVFLYFLQKKGWLGVQLVPNELPINEYNDLLNSNDSVSNNLIKQFYELKEDVYVIDKNKLRSAEVHDVTNFSNIFIKTKYNMPWGTGKKDFIRTIYKQAIKEHKNFFDSYVEQFFYNGLNEKRDNQYFALFNCKIPFLNGGLFEPLNNYRWSSSRFSIPNDMFSNDDKNGILDFLDLYNFTIDEEEPLEKEIAVDPEMLGKIFENLLDVKDRKSTGSFYTPREIVHHMCQESLANYVATKLKLPYDEILNFIKYGDIITQSDWENFYNKNIEHILPDSIWKNIIQIDKALLDVKIADPAVGSGAFPLGMLNEIVKLRDNITSYILIQEDKNLLSRTEINQEQLIRDIYSMKIQTIQNSIYAVDLEISAVDIAKLRIWLSLIVDYPNEQEPKPLPNLDCKIMQGNSLLDEYDGISLFNPSMLEKHLKNYKRRDEKDIKSIKLQFSLLNQEEDLDLQMRQLMKYQEEYFITNDPSRKKELKKLIEDIQYGMISLSLGYNTNKMKEINELAKKKSKQWFIWKLEFFDVFKQNGGFDIVIGNPPYVGEKGNKDIFRPIAKTEFGKKFYQGKMDLFYFFFHKGIDLLKDNGILSFITTNYYVTATGAKKLRYDFYDRTNIISLINFNEYKIFENALGQHNIITTLQKNVDKKNNNYLSRVLFTNKKGYYGDEVLTNIINGKDEDTFYYSIQKNHLYDTEEKYIRFKLDKEENNKIISKMKFNSKNLIDICNVNSGCDITISEIMSKHVEFNKKYHKGDGVFVVQKDELIYMNLEEREQKKIKSFIKNSNISHFSYKLSEKKLLYLTWEDNIELYPNIKNHLLKFKEILDDQIVRYEENYPWFALHRPREIKIFESDKKIICPYRSRYNYFSLAEEPVFASRDVFFITPKFNDMSVNDMKYLVGILNSKTYYYWLFNCGKRKGNILELYYKPLSEIPISFPDDEIKSNIIKCVDKVGSELDCKSAIDIIDSYLYKFFNFTSNEIAEIENKYRENIV